MALSDELARVATRASEAEERTAAAAHAAAQRGQTDLERARTDLEQEVSSARQSAQAQAEKLRGTADASRAKVAGWSTDVQRSFNEHIAKAREGIDTKRAEHDVRKAKNRADDAERYAVFASDLAYSVVVEAEYAALDAVLARMDAEQIEQQKTPSGATT